MVQTTHRPINPPADPSDPRSPAYLTSMQKRLQELANAMWNADRVLQEKRRGLAQHQSLYAGLLSETQLDINAEGTFTNDKARGAELNRRLRVNPYAETIQKAIDDDEVAIAQGQATFEQARRERANLLAILNAAAAWLTYWAASRTETEEESR